jgi:capsular exopolysaccharide synthesis family protein
MVANELANQLILRSPSGELSADQVRRDFINQQIDDLQTQIVNTQDEIAQLQEKLGNLNSASEIQDAQNEITAQQQKLSTLQGTYANLLLNTQQGATNSLIVVEPAEIPTTPIGPNKNLTVLIAAGIGFILAAGAAYLLDYLDDTLKTPEEVNRVLGLPVIGFIAETREPDNGKNGVYVSKNPRSPVAEAYRSLRANLQFMSEEHAIKSILITSTNIGVGKTSVATNLAAVLTQGDKNVVLIDADLHKPKIHEVVSVTNKFGLTDVCLNGLNIEKALINFKDEKFKIIPSGRSIENPVDLLASEKIDQLLEKLEEIADYIIIDSPPLIVADALFLAAKVDGILLVVRPGHIRKKVAVAMMEQFNRAGARVLGVVFNRIPLTGFDAYGGVNYYSTYYTSDQDSKITTPSNFNEYLHLYYEKAQAGIKNIRSKKAN